MFDRSVVVLPRPRDTHVHVTERVVEQRAPTDESVRLLKEMEQAAHDKLLDSIKIADTGFECVVHVMRDPLAGDILMRAIVSVNGRKLTADHRGDGRDVAAMARGLVDAVAHEIADHVVRPALVKSMADWLPRGFR